MRLLFIAVLLPRLALGDVDAGTSEPIFDWTSPTYADCPAAEPPTPLDGGSYLFSAARLKRVECGMASCDARRRELEPQPPIPEFTSRAWLMGWVMFGLGVLLGGGGVAYLWWRVMR